MRRQYEKLYDIITTKHLRQVNRKTSTKTSTYIHLYNGYDGSVDCRYIVFYYVVHSWRDSNLVYGIDLYVYGLVICIEESSGTARSPITARQWRSQGGFRGFSPTFIEDRF